MNPCDVYPILRFFDYSHLPEHLRECSARFHNLAWKVAEDSPTGDPETTEALRKLLEAKDCAVRARLTP